MLLLNIMERRVPKRKETGQNRKKAMWMSNKAVQAVKAKHKCYVKYKSQDHPVFKRACSRAVKGNVDE